MSEACVKKENRMGTISIKRKCLGFILAVLATGMTACKSQPIEANAHITNSVEASTNAINLVETNVIATNESQESEENTVNANKINIQIGDKTLTATLADNEAARELKRIIAEEGLTIQFSMYGGFEQVGSIGRRLPTQDVQTWTSAGDIMLYSGNQIVMFYGKHSWSYTRLGKINASESELSDILDSNNVTATFTLAD